MKGRSTAVARGEHGLAVLRGVGVDAGEPARCREVADRDVDVAPGDSYGRRGERRGGAVRSRWSTELDAAGPYDDVADAGVAVGRPHGDGGSGEGLTVEPPGVHASPTANHAEGTRVRCGETSRAGRERGMTLDPITARAAAGVARRASDVGW